ncbi:GNAT family N-acetyltransferase [uncultured Pontibacter sp.]|uniref:GNAT family N-acetyltransferase n=1 Tax=uncultured Pontibacter sp. TaxID=453356 RepID=UPI00261FAAF5|nr:GNAT family N-acetyltransferase [uncultured Pontibacter sp.]
MRSQIDTAVTQSDYLELTDLWEASVRATHHFLQEEDIRYFRPLILNQYLQAVELACARDVQNRIIGFIGIAAGKIEMLFLHPDYRGKGIGKMLVQYAVEECNAKQVDVNEQNIQAVTFYQHMGFHIIGRTEQDSMGKPYPILHMERNKV